jgi:hypothetical protein
MTKRAEKRQATTLGRVSAQLDAFVTAEEGTRSAQILKARHDMVSNEPGTVHGRLTSLLGLLTIAIALAALVATTLPLVFRSETAGPPIIWVGMGVVVSILLGFATAFFVCQEARRQPRYLEAALLVSGFERLDQTRMRQEERQVRLHVETHHHTHTTLFQRLFGDDGAKSKTCRIFDSRTTDQRTPQASSSSRQR